MIVATGSDKKLSLRRVRCNEEDARLLLGWRNDATTRAASFDATVREWRNYWPWFTSSYFPEGPPAPVIAEIDGIPIASVRFDTPRLLEFVRPGVVEISIHVAPETRRRGIGLEVLKLCREYLLASDIHLIVALVKADNTPSLRFFARAGYRFVKTDTVYLPGHNDPFNVSVFTCELR